MRSVVMTLQDAAKEGVHHGGISITFNDNLNLAQEEMHGHLEAQVVLGKRYEEGLGVNHDWDEALRLWRKAASNGSGEAYFCLYQCYFLGQGGVSRDPSAAMKHLKRSAELKFPKVMGRYAKLLSRQNGNVD